ncbi:hypothetical protein SDC9_38404 [bioreactor metagenome]|uniref:Uncharacterized protein n=1 Tax=bioreactor metagenome TaxID=1076179 RepID=A0A644VLU2_9ZZZZ
MGVDLPVEPGKAGEGEAEPDEGGNAGQPRQPGHVDQEHLGDGQRHPRHRDPAQRQRATRHGRDKQRERGREQRDGVAVKLAIRGAWQRQVRPAPQPPDLEPAPDQGGKARSGGEARAQQAGAGPSGRTEEDRPRGKRRGERPEGEREAVEERRAKHQIAAPVEHVDEIACQRPECTERGKPAQPCNDAAQPADRPPAGRHPPDLPEGGAAPDRGAESGEPMGMGVPVGDQPGDGQHGEQRDRGHQRRLEHRAQARALGAGQAAGGLEGSDRAEMAEPEGGPACPVQAPVEARIGKQPVADHRNAKLRHPAHQRQPEAAVGQRGQHDQQRQPQRQRRLGEQDEEGERNQQHRGRGEKAKVAGQGLAADPGAALGEQHHQRRHRDHHERPGAGPEEKPRRPEELECEDRRGAEFRRTKGPEHRVGLAACARRAQPREGKGGKRRAGKRKRPERRRLRDLFSGRGIQRGEEPAEQRAAVHRLDHQRKEEAKRGQCGERIERRGAVEPQAGRREQHDEQRKADAGFGRGRGARDDHQPGDGGNGGARRGDQRRHLGPRAAEKSGDGRAGVARRQVALGEGQRGEGQHQRRPGKARGEGDGAPEQHEAKTRDGKRERRDPAPAAETVDRQTGKADEREVAVEEMRAIRAAADQEGRGAGADQPDRGQHRPVEPAEQHGGGRDQRQAGQRHAGADQAIKRMRCRHRDEHHHRPRARQRRGQGARRGRHHIAAAAPDRLAAGDQAEAERERAEHAQGRRQKALLDAILHHEEPAEDQRQRGDGEGPVRAQPGGDGGKRARPGDACPGRRRHGLRQRRRQRSFRRRRLGGGDEPGRGRRRRRFLHRGHGVRPERRRRRIGPGGGGFQRGDLFLEPPHPTAQRRHEEQQHRQADAHHRAIGDPENDQKKLEIVHAQLQC